MRSDLVPPSINIELRRLHRLLGDHDAIPSDHAWRICGDHRPVHAFQVYKEEFGEDCNNNYI